MGNSDEAQAAVTQKRVLCASDLSERCTGALRAAWALSDRMHARLILGHMLSMHTTVASDHTRRRLQQHLSALPPGVNWPDMAWLRGVDRTRVIAQIVEDTAADLTVMGSQRRRLLTPLLGTTAEGVLALTRRPVLVVRSDGGLQYDRIVVATDLGDSLLEVMRMAATHRLLEGPAISIVHGSNYNGPVAQGPGLTRRVARWKASVLERLRSLLSSAGRDASRFDIRVENERPLRIISRLLDGQPSSLLIMGESTHTALARAFEGSLANEALLELNCDVLVSARPRGNSHLH